MADRTTHFQSLSLLLAASSISGLNGSYRSEIVGGGNRKRSGDLAISFAQSEPETEPEKGVGTPPVSTTIAAIYPTWERNRDADKLTPPNKCGLALKELRMLPN